MSENVPPVEIFGDALPTVSDRLVDAIEAYLDAQAKARRTASLNNQKKAVALESGIRALIDKYRGKERTLF